jgi:hypothetical protein
LLLLNVDFHGLVAEGLVSEGSGITTSTPASFEGLDLSEERWGSRVLVGVNGEGLTLLVDGLLRSNSLPPSEVIIVFRDLPSDPGHFLGNLNFAFLLGRQAD